MNRNTSKLLDGFHFSRKTYSPLINIFQEKTYSMATVGWFSKEHDQRKHIQQKNNQAKLKKTLRCQWQKVELSSLVARGWTLLATHFEKKNQAKPLHHYSFLRERSWKFERAYILHLNLLLINTPSLLEVLS